jgi:hypothetical protein
LRVADCSRLLNRSSSGFITVGGAWFFMIYFNRLENKMEKIGHRPSFPEESGFPEPVLRRWK